MIPTQGKKFEEKRERNSYHAPVGLQAKKRALPGATWWKGGRTAEFSPLSGLFSLTGVGPGSTGLFVKLMTRQPCLNRI